MPKALLLALLLAAVPALLRAAEPPPVSDDQVSWSLDRLDQLGGHRTTVVGSPRLIETPEGKAVQFDGRGDALLIDAHPLASLAQFTAEVIFQPQADGPKEQRFLHFQEDGSENRLLFETRLTDDGRWFLDTFLKSGEGSYTLFAERSLHPIGPWYHAAVTMDGRTMRHYVNGVEELSMPVENFVPLAAGRTSIGVRINQVHWYKGVIRQIRITPRVLAPRDFLTVSPPPATGEARPELAGFDAWMQSFMAEHQVPGGALAIVRGGKLIYARGFGWADRETKEPVQPDSLFRIASVSKPITAVAIVKLAEQGKLRLDDKVLDHLHYQPHFEEGGKFDERWREVTIAHCLAHAGGWDRGISYDPMFQAVRMARSLKIELPILPEHIIRYQLGQPLDFSPGERYAYSNFGYSLLGRIIEKVTGQPYEQYVQEEVFKSLGITRARLGGSLESERAEGEVRYYDIKGQPGVAIVGPGAGEREVPVSYGVWRQETLDSHGGWIASAPDLARFAAAFDLIDDGRRTRGGILKPETVRQMFSPHVPVPSTEDKTKIAGHYGYGWTLKDEASGMGKTGMVARHGGALPCTAASLMHFPDGTNLAVLFNLGQFPDGRFLGRSLEPPLTELVHKLLP